MNRQVIAVMRQRWPPVNRSPWMYQEPGLAGLAWLEWQAEVAEEQVAQRQAEGQAP